MKGSSILLVDDEETILKSYSKDLSGYGYHVETASNGADAITKLKKHNGFNIIITDLLMPGMTGLDVLKTVKGNGSEVGVIILTGQGDMTTAVKALQEDADDYLCKPCDIEELNFRIERCLEKQNYQKEIRQANEALSRSHDQLKSKVKVIEDLNEELIERKSEMERFVYLTTHDLRGPVININGFSKLLMGMPNKIGSIINKGKMPQAIKEECESLLENDMKPVIDFIQSSSSKLENLINGLLQMSRLGHVELMINEIDMNELFSGIKKTFEFEIQKKGIEIVVEALPPCIGDAKQIDQVFSNLLGNALKYLNPKRQGIITISGKSDKGKAVFCVEDNGVGISPSSIKRIFEIFHRSDPGSIEGEGLGLTIVKKIVERHRGEVWVESEPDKGSKFFVSMPMG